MMLAGDAARDGARIILWLPMKMLRLLAVLMVLSPLIMGCSAENLAAAALGCLLYACLPRLWRRLGGGIR